MSNNLYVHQGSAKMTRLQVLAPMKLKFFSIRRNCFYRYKYSSDGFLYRMPNVCVGGLLIKAGSVFEVAGQLNCSYLPCSTGHC